MQDDLEQEVQFAAFPYQPYPIQLGFMRAVYSTLQQGGVGLFESPTGTGKTLSLICSSLQWLQDAQRQSLQARSASGKGAADAGTAEHGRGKVGDNTGSSDEEPDWMKEHSARQEEEAQRQAEERLTQRLQAVREGLAAKRTAACKEQRRNPGKDSTDPDAEFLMDDWGDPGDGSPALGTASPAPANKRRRVLAGSSGRGDVVLEFSSNDEDDEKSDDLGEMSGGAGTWGAVNPAEISKRQVIFSSRTHSQLSQFVGELRRTPFADSLSLVALASRKALCINDSVRGLGSPALINERCLDMQRGGGKAKGKKAGRCPYLACGSKAAATTHDIILAQPMDIEELESLGRRKAVCPYYAARRALPDADVVLAPYSSLLVSDTRASLGLQLPGNVIIVDEGHNLVDAINSSHSADLTRTQATAAHLQLAAYFERFRTQLAPGNARNLQILMSAASALSRQLDLSIGTTGGTASAGGSTATVHTVNDFLISSGLDNINLFKLVQYVRESKAVFKVAGYAQSRAQRAAAGPAAAGGTPTCGAQQEQNMVQQGVAEGGSTGALHAVVGFLQALTNDDSDGRVILDRRCGTLRFVLLNAAAHFAKLVSTAHAVVLASGTLSPIEPVLQLFPFTPRDRILHYTCGHVVSKDRLLALAVGSGPSGVQLDFRHGTRATPAVLDELGRLVVNVAKVVPGGVVVFFPSFSYADQVHSRWEYTGMLRQLAARKEVFREPRDAAEVDALMQQYAACIHPTRTTSSSECGGVGGSGGRDSVAGDAGAGGGVAPVAKGPKGAVLLCVVGGKLSEGINFGDALGRCMIMVGLPYPNPSDPELQERLRYIDRQHAQQGECQNPPQQAHQLQGSEPPRTSAGRGASGQQGSQGPVMQGNEPALPCTAAGAAEERLPLVPSQALSMGGARGSGACGKVVGGAQSRTPASRQYYEDLCMKAVNQCVGRVVRHAGDYAAVLLVDMRYAAAAAGSGASAGGWQGGSSNLGGPLGKLPGWVRDSFVAPGGGSGGFGEAYSQLVKFFKRMESETCCK